MRFKVDLPGLDVVPWSCFHELASQHGQHRPVSSSLVQEHHMFALALAL